MSFLVLFFTVVGLKSMLKKKKSQEEAREKGYIMYKENPIILTADFSAEIL